MCVPVGAVRVAMTPRGAGVVAALAVPRLWHSPLQDEIFHVRQTQQYCRGDFAHWDPKITTFPGLYLLGSAFGRLAYAVGLGVQVRMGHADLGSGGRTRAGAVGGGMHATAAAALGGRWAPTSPPPPPLAGRAVRPGGASGAQPGAGRGMRAGGVRSGTLRGAAGRGGAGI